MTGQSKLAFVVILALILTFAACSGGDDKNETASGRSSPKAAGSADEAVTRVASGLADGRPEVLWQALPASYQDDVTELVHGAAAKMDAEMWNRTFGVLDKLGRVMSEKREFILAHPMVAGQLTDPRAAHSDWDAVVGVFDAVVKSDLADLEKVRQLDVETFLATTGGKLMRQLAEASALTADNAWAQQMENLRNTSAKVVSSSGDRASVWVETPGEQPKEEDYVRVEGKWIPARMVDEWDAEIAEAREKIAGYSGEENAEKKQTTLMQLAMAESVLDTVLAAKNTQEFNASIGSIMGLAMSAAAQAPVTPRATVSMPQPGNPQPPSGAQTIQQSRPLDVPVEFAVTPQLPVNTAPTPVEEPVDPDAVSPYKADRFVGEWMRVEGHDGLDFKGELVSADDGVLRFQRRYHSGTAWFEIQPGEVATLTLHNR